MQHPNKIPVIIIHSHPLKWEGRGVRQCNQSVILPPIFPNRLQGVYNKDEILRE